MTNISPLESPQAPTSHEAPLESPQAPTSHEAPLESPQAPTSYPQLPMGNRDFNCFIDPRVHLGVGRWSVSTMSTMVQVGTHSAQAVPLYKRLIPASATSIFSCSGFNQMENPYTGMRDRLTSFTEWRFKRGDITLRHNIYALGKLLLAEPDFIERTFEPLHHLSPSHMASFFRDHHSMNFEHWTLYTMHLLMSPLGDTIGPFDSLHPEILKIASRKISAPQAGGSYLPDYSILRERNNECRRKATFYSLASSPHQLFNTLEEMVTPKPYKYTCQLQARDKFANHLWMVDAARMVTMDDFFNTGRVGLNVLFNTGQAGQAGINVLNSAGRQIHEDFRMDQARAARGAIPQIDRANLDCVFRGVPLEDVIAGDFGSLNAFDAFDAFGGKTISPVATLNACNYRRLLMTYTYTLDTIRTKPLTAWRVKDEERFSELMRILGAHGDSYNRDLILRYFGMYPAQSLKEPEESVEAVRLRGLGGIEENGGDPRESFYEYSTKATKPGKKGE